MLFTSYIIIHNIDSIPGFSWSRENTKLLLDKYNDRKDKFRDPKIKKKTLWAEIVKEFEIKGYNVTEEILDRKMRNLKHSYKSIKDNNKKTNTGRGRINWEWFCDMENIFREDRTINIGSTLASLVSPVEKKVMLNNSSHPSCTTYEEDEHVTFASNYSELRENEMNDVFSACRNDPLDPSLPSDPSAPTINSVSDIALTASCHRKNKKEKSTRAKAVYELRKKQLDCEEKRVSAINELKEIINKYNVLQEENNGIQKERNEILRALINK